MGGLRLPVAKTHRVSFFESGASQWMQITKTAFNQSVVLQLRTIAVTQVLTEQAGVAGVLASLDLVAPFLFP